MNKVILIGRLVRDPELRTTPNGISVARFSIAVSRPYSTQNAGNPGVDFINCVVWRRQAENLAKYCHKGSQIAIDGRIQTSNFVGQDGNKRYVTEVLCDNISFLGSKADNMANQNFSSQNSFDNNFNTYNNNFNNAYPIPNYDSDNSIPAIDSTNINTELSSSSNDLDEDPFKNFGEEVILNDDDLPF